MSKTLLVVGQSPRAVLFAQRAGLLCVEKAPAGPHIWVPDDENSAVCETDIALPDAALANAALPDANVLSKGIELRGFVEGNVRHALQNPADLRRFAEQGLRQSDLGRAVGAHKKISRILDVTAGLGRDACTLAAMGWQVTALERSPILAALWQDALFQSGESFVKKISFSRGEALETLQEMASWPKEKRPEVVFLDPMFPARKKKAAVKKELRALKELLKEESLFGEPEIEGAALVSAAQKVATERVVVKRPVRAPALGPVSFSKASKVLRIDVLLIPQD